jgi:hypothetical protein
MASRSLRDTPPRHRFDADPRFADARIFWMVSKECGLPM